MADGDSSERILIDIDLNYEDAVKGAAKFKQQLMELQSQQRELTKAFNDGDITVEEYTKASVELTGKIKAAREIMNGYQREITTTEKTMNNQLGSYESLNAALINLRKQYQQLSESERNAAKGQDILKHMRELDTQLKSIDTDMGLYFRNIGNYPSAITSLIPGFDKLNSTLSSMGVSFDTLRTQGVKAFANLGTSAKAFGSVMLTPPVVVIAATLSAILLVFNKVSEAIQKNDDVATKLQASYARLQPIINAINFIFDQLAQRLADIIDLGTKVLDVVLGLIPGYRKASEAAQELVHAEDNLQESERQYVKESAQRQAEIEKLRNDALKTERYTAEERQRMLEESIRLMKEDADAQLHNLNEHIRIAKARAAQEQDTSDATKDAISAMEAKRDEAEAKFYSQSRRMISQLNTLSRQTGIAMSEMSLSIDEAAENSGIAFEEMDEAINGVSYASAVDRTEEFAKRAADIHKQLRDVVISTIKDAGARAKAELDARYGDEITALKARLENEESLTEQEKDDLCEIIRIKEQQLMDAVQEIDDTANEKRIEREYAAALEAVRLRISAATKGSEEEYQAKTALLEMQREKELRNAELTEQERLNIEEKYRQQSVSLEKQRAKDTAAAMRSEFKAMEADLEGMSLAEGILPERDVHKINSRWREFLREKLDTLKDTYGEMIEESAEYLETLQEYNDAVITEQKDRTQDGVEEASELVGTMTSTFSQMFSQLFSDGTIQLGEFLKNLITMMLDTIETALLGYYAQIYARNFALYGPAGAAQAAVQIAYVAAAFELAKAFAGSLSFETGGIIPGTSEKGDKVIAHVNSGEMILNKEQQAQTYTALTGKKVTAGTITGSQQEYLFALLGGEIGGRGNFATGGIVSSGTVSEITRLVSMTAVVSTSPSGITVNDLMEALEDIPSPVLEYSEFKRFERRRERSVGYAQLRK